MVKILWGLPGSKKFDLGIDRGVLYPMVGNGVAWNGLISIAEVVDGGEHEAYYQDGVKYLDVFMTDSYQANIEAFAVPAEFAPSEGLTSLALGLVATRQPRRPFGICYRAQYGNDLTSSAGYKLHLVYGLMAGPAESTKTTQGSQNEPSRKSLTVFGVPPTATTFKPTAHLIVDSVAANATKLATLEDLLYGTASTAPALPAQSLVISTLA